jgi:membrane protease YdiL (CAAX protease family)
VAIKPEGWGFKYPFRYQKCPSPVFSAYLIVWLFTLFFHFFYTNLRGIVLPFLLLIIPLSIRGDIHLRFRFKDLLAGIFVSITVLVPLGFSIIAFANSLTFYKTFRQLFLSPPVGWDIIIYQLFGVAFPEEVFFRGFIQESLGRSISSIVYTSLLFSLCHLPSVIAGSSPVVLLTFFPSLIMGALYYWTSNILPSVVFHFLSNIFFISLIQLMPE